MENNAELIPVTLWLAERGYRIKIKKEEEEAIRRAAKVADKRVTELRSSFQGKDTQDFLAMALLMYATEQATDPHELNAIDKDTVAMLNLDLTKELNDSE